MRIRSASILAAVVCCFASASAFAANPAYDSWAKCKPGSSVTMSGATEASGMKTQSEMTYTLKDITPDKATVEIKTTMTVMGNKMDSPATTIEIPSAGDGKAPTPPAGAPAADVKTSQEKVTVGGKDYDATCTTTKTDTNGMKMTSMVWTSPDVPGMTLKIDSEGEGTMKMLTKMEVTKIDVK